MVCTSAMILAPAAWADWPVSLVDNITVHQSQSEVLVDVLDNDIGDNLKITTVNAWSRNGGRAKTDGIYLRYTPPHHSLNYTGGIDSFWYDIVDDQGRTNAAKVTVNIKPLTSRFPDPQPDVVRVQKDTGIRIDVLKNDIADLPRYTEFSTVSEQGGKIVQVDKQLHYTPPAGFVGTDIFWYKIKNGLGLDPTEHATEVTVQVTEEEGAGPYPTTKPDTYAVDASCDPSRPPYYCISPALDVLQNDTGENLRLILTSAWSLKGAQVRVSYDTVTGYHLSYIGKPRDTEDKIWYIIEDEIGRKNWGVVTLSVTY